MPDKTGISWTNATWNPIVGCSIVSPGCINCYAMKMADKIQRMYHGANFKAGGGCSYPPSPYDGTTKIVNGNPVWTGDIHRASEETFTAPLRWKKPRRIFVNSMSDLFHEAVPDDWIDQVFAIMALCPQHTFQVLTKRSGRMREFFWSPDNGEGNRARWAARAGRMMEDGDNVHDYVLNLPYPLPNVWLGVSAEDQQRADERVPDLLATPAAKRFVSAEPLLGKIDFQNIMREDAQFRSLTGIGQEGGWQEDCAFKHAKLDWIIVGGESGPVFRPMQIEWAEDIMQQCKDAGTAFFFKQDSGHKPGMQGRASDVLWACKEFPQ